MFFIWDFILDSIYSLRFYLCFDIVSCSLAFMDRGMQKLSKWMFILVDLHLIPLWKLRCSIVGFIIWAAVIFLDKKSLRFQKLTVFCFLFLFQFVRECSFTVIYKNRSQLPKCQALMLRLIVCWTHFLYAVQTNGMNEC